MTLEIVLPWPPPELWPNNHRHWSAKYPVQLKARHDGKYATLEVRDNWHVPPDGPLALALTFCPPSARRWDDDGAVGAFKHYRDGIADALGVDDTRFRLVVVRGEKCKGGAVIVRIGDTP